MSSKNVSVKLKGNQRQYEISISNEILYKSGDWAQNCLTKNTQKIVLVSNEKIFGLYGKTVEQSFENKGFKVFTWLMEDGEEHKSLSSFRECLSFFSQTNLKRSDAVVALGGGVVGDLAGFAAATYLRGVDFLQIPTTLLAMIDSSVGGKTAVNTEFGKNLVGAFYQPKGVLIDVRTLQTLENREVVAGFCEAIKQGAIGNKELFDETSDFLTKYKIENFHDQFGDSSFLNNLEKLLASQVSFKAEIVMQDEQEATIRSDVKSRKILNFGHTTAHALEKITDYKVFKHGEAVGLGMLVAGEISKRLEICDSDSINLLNDVVSSVGELPDTSEIDIQELYDLFLFDKKAIGRSLQWVLLEGIGNPKILSNNVIPVKIIKESLQKILHR